MRKEKKIFLIAIGILVMFAGCGTTHTVYRVDKDISPSLKKTGIFYALPQTEIAVEIPVKLIKFTPGKLSEDAMKVFTPEAIEKIYSKGFDVTIARNFFSIGDPSFSTKAIPDPKQIFLVKIKGNNIFENRQLFMELSESGFLKHSKTDAEDITADFVIASLEAAASIAGAVIGLNIPGFTGAPEDTPEFEKQLKNIKDVQKRILDLMSGRTNRGVQEINIELYNKMLADLKAKEKELISAFLGKIDILEWKAKYLITPPPLSDEKTDTPPLPIVKKEGIPIFEYSLKDGIKINTNLKSGVKLVNLPPRQIPAIFKINSEPKSFITKEGKLKNGKTVYLEIDDSFTKQFAGVIKGTGAIVKLKKSGFFYRIPASVNVSIVEELTANEKDRMILAKDNLSIAQYGVVNALPRKTGSSRRSAYDFNLYEETGALKNILVTSVAFDPDGVRKLGNAATTVIKATDEIAALERKKKKLDLEKAIDLIENPPAPIIETKTP